MLECAVQEEQLEKYFGKYPGLVLKNTAPDGEAHLGELLVEVSGILEEDPGGEGQRPIQVWAKPCFFPGFFFIPEVGAQVWVEFIAGDINQPLWTGVWYPTEAVPQTIDGESPTEFQKVIRTRMASGRVIQLDDSDGAEKLVIADETNGNTITMDADGVKLRDGHGNAVTLDSNGVKLEGPNGTITLDSNGIKLEVASSAITVGDTGVKITDGTGTGQQQLVVLAPLLDWLPTHQHVGNLGAPTPPFPADIVTFVAQQMTMKSGMG